MTVEKFLQKHAKKLSKNRGGWICCCIYPSHRDSTPSFHVSWEGLFYCWGCGKKGSFAALLHDIEGYSWKKSIDIANLISKQIKSSKDPLQWMTEEEQPKLSNGLLGMFDVNWEEGYERYRLAEGDVLPPWTFPFEKGFIPDTLKHFKAGYDDDKQRATIPVFVKKKLQGFIGRTCTDSFPKYYIYPPLKTAQHLYNADSVRPSDEYVVLVEGAWDVWMLWQRKFQVPVVSLFTSKVTTEQAAQLTALNRRYVVMFDADKAGKEGALEVAQKLLARGLRISVGMNFPQGVADIKKLSLDQLNYAFAQRKPWPALSAMTMLRSEHKVAT